jgi:hypothetical protein
MARDVLARMLKRKLDRVPVFAVGNGGFMVRCMEKCCCGKLRSDSYRRALLDSSNTQLPLEGIVCARVAFPSVI